MVDVGADVLDEAAKSHVCTLSAPADVAVADESLGIDADVGARDSAEGRSQYEEGDGAIRGYLGLSVLNALAKIRDSHA